MGRFEDANRQLSAPAPALTATRGCSACEEEQKGHVPVAEGTSPRNADGILAAAPAAANEVSVPGTSLEPSSLAAPMPASTSDVASVAQSEVTQAPQAAVQPHVPPAQSLEANPSSLQADVGASMQGDSTFSQTEAGALENSMEQGESVTAPTTGQSEIIAPEHPGTAEPIGPVGETGTQFRPQGEIADAAVKDAASGLEFVEASSRAESVKAEDAPLVVADSAKELRAGQMRKSDFLATVREEVRGTVEEVIAPSGRSTADCPYLQFIFDYFARQSARSIERTLRRFAAEGSPITTLESALALITARARQAAEVWVETGRITGLPKGVPATVIASAADAESPEAGLSALQAGLTATASEGSGGANDTEEIQARLGSGRALEGDTKSRMESAFGYDFSGVRVHTDGAAGHLASSLSARAFTIGQHVAFKAGEYAPGSPMGDALLAHELAHVVQQRTATEATHENSPRAMSEQEALEQDADQSSMSAMGSLWAGAKGRFAKASAVAMPRLRSGLRLQRCSNNRPPARVPPQVPAAPRPADPFQGVTFALNNQQATGASPAANIRIVQEGGRPFLFMQGTQPANYQPEITITAPSDARAREFEVGIIQNLLSETLEYTFTAGGPIHSTLPTPIKDGAPRSSGMYDEDFAENGTGHPGILVPFTSSGDTARLNLPDTPSDGAFINLQDNPECGAGAPAATMTNAVFHDPFRTWVGVRHQSSGTVKTIHHIDWEIDFSATVDGTVNPPTRTVTSDSVNVTEANGDGRPAFIRGGDVPADLLATHRVCGP